MVSDTVSAALVAEDGTADWWCPWRFDAAPLFTRLLEPGGGCLRVGPASPGRPPVGSQRYRDGTLVLATRLPGPESLVEVEDVLTWEGPSRAGRFVRRLRVLRGPVRVAVEVVPAGDPRDVAAWSEGMAFAGVQVRCGLPFSLSSVVPPAPARPVRRLVVSAEATLDTGASLVVTVDPLADGAPPLSPDAAARLIDRTATAWHRVWETIELTGPHADAAARSLLVVAALAGEGAPVAAPTTSLPRVVGGERHLDGRTVAVVPVASWTAVAAACGLHEQADSGASWLARALDHPPPLPSVLGVDGDAPPTEAHLTGLSGWRRSQPVVAGTNAPDRLTAEASAAAVAAAASLGDRPDCGALLAAWPRVVDHGDWLAEGWSGADATVWDLRRATGTWVSPRLPARHALASAAQAARRRNPLDLGAVGWWSAARDIERWLTVDALDRTGSLRAVIPDGDGSDAALARAAWLGPWPAADPVVRGTLDRIIERNGEGVWIHPRPPELDDGLPGTEPASVVATLWVARALALAGRWDEADERIEAVVALGGILHLLPEAVDPVAGTGLGNRPWSPAHIALVEAVLARR